MSGTKRQDREGYCAVCGAPTTLTIVLSPPPSLPEVTVEGYEYRCEKHVR